MSAGAGDFPILTGTWLNCFARAVISENATWITEVTPFICLSAYLAAGSLIPLGPYSSLGFGDLIAFTYLLALSRFFLALAALEPGSAFGGMGSSREMMIATLVEPVLIVGLFGLVAAAGTTELSGLRGAGQNPAGLLAFVGLMVVTIAETGRIPVDNPDTHLELTMVHEAMLLEYAGRPLGFLHLASMVLNRRVLLSLLVYLFWPQPLAWQMSLALAGITGQSYSLGFGFSHNETYPGQR